MARPEYFRFTEADIRYAMANSKNNRDAANFMNVHWTTYKKYASRYIDQETGVTLYKKHTPQWQKKHNWKQYWMDNIRVPFNGSEPTPMEDLLQNKAFIKDRNHFMSRLITEGIKKKECELCGHNRGPIYDYSNDKHKSFKALRTYRLINLDMNEKNNSLENLVIVCLNCNASIFSDKERYRQMITHPDGSIMDNSEIALMILHRETIRTIYDEPGTEREELDVDLPDIDSDLIP